MTTAWPRRRLLALIGSGGATTLAGCLGDDESADGTPTPDGSTPTATAPERTTGTSSPTATRTDAGSPSLAFDHPEDVDFDEPFGLRIDGLPARTTAEVTVDASAGDQSYTVSTTIETEDGSLDLADATVVDGAVPPELGVPTTVALLQFAEPPEEYLASASEETLTYRVDAGNGGARSTSLRRMVPDFVTFERPDRADIVGGLFTPPGGARGPGVVFLHGSQPQPALLQSALLAQQGFTAFAPIYYDGPGLPESLLEVPVEYVQTVAEWLLAHERTVGDRVGLAGSSRGGELALLAGSQFDSVGPVVSVSGSGVVWEGFDQELRFANESSWTIDGEPVPYIRVVAGTQSYPTAFARATDDRIAAATIPVENIEGPILLVSGGDDQLWPATRLQTIATDRLAANGRDDFEHLVYEEAGHSILPRYVPVEGSLYINGISRGGTLAANAEASHNHWPHVIETLSALKD